MRMLEFDGLLNNITQIDFRETLAFPQSASCMFITIQTDLIFHRFKQILHNMSFFFRVDILVRIGQVGEELVCLGYPRSIMLCQTYEKHYDPLYTKDYINDSAFCQSVIYEALYKRVFQLKEVDYAVAKMLRDKTAKMPRDRLAIYGNR